MVRELRIHHSNFNNHPRRWSIKLELENSAESVKHIAEWTRQKSFSARLESFPIVNSDDPEEREGGKLLIGFEHARYCDSHEWPFNNWARIETYFQFSVLSFSSNSNTIENYLSSWPNLRVVCEHGNWIRCYVNCSYTTSSCMVM